MRWTGIAILGWVSIERVLHGESSHVGSIKMARNELIVEVEQAGACSTTFIVSVGSCSGTVRHEPVHR